MIRATPKKKPPVILVSEEGKEMFEGDDVFWAYKNFKKTINRKLVPDLIPKIKGIKAFSTELAAQQFLGIAPKYKYDGVIFKSTLSNSAYKAVFSRLDNFNKPRYNMVDLITGTAVAEYGDTNCNNLLRNSSYIISS